MKSKGTKFGALLVLMLLFGVVMTPAVSADKIADVKSEDKKPTKMSKHVSKPEILLNESGIKIKGISDPTPSTSGLTLKSSDSSDVDNIWGSSLTSYRMYSLDEEEDPDYDYYVIWVQSTAKRNLPFDLDWIKVGVENLQNGQIVDWSPQGTTYTCSGEETTISLGVNVGVASGSIAQTFNDPTGKIYPNVFTTTQFESMWKATGGTYDPGFSTGGVQVKSPTGEIPSFTYYSSAY
ncbi:MAG: hypothetical protein ACT6FG_01605 [Methanosarcinaceae archaeon]